MILTIGPGGSGLTFLSWSILYLRGDTMYTDLTGTTSEITSNPITGCIAHNFTNRDHLVSIKELSRLNQATPKSVVYVVPRNQVEFENLLALPGRHIVFVADNDQEEFFARMCETIPDNQYATLIAELSTRYSVNIIKQVLLNYNRLFTQYYTLPQTMPPNVCTVSYEDIFKQLDSAIFSLFDFLELSIDSERFQHWQIVYNEYREKNQKFLQRFLPNRCEVDTEVKIKILKEILPWRNGLPRHIR